MKSFKNLIASGVCFIFVLTLSTVKPIAWEDKLKTLQGLQLGGKNVFQNIEGTTDLAGVLNSDWSTLNPDLIGAGGILTKKQSKDGKKQLEALNKAIEKDNNFTKDDGKAISKFFDAAIKAHGGKSAGAVAEPIAWEDKLKTLQGLQLGGKNVFQNIEGTTDLAGVLNSDWSTLNPDLIGAGGILTKKQSKDGKEQLEALNKVIEKDNNFTKDDGKAISKFFDAAIKAHDGKSAGAVTESIAWEDKLKTLQGLQLGGKNVFQNIEGTTDLAGVLNSDWSTLNPDLIGAGGILTKKQSKDGKKQLEALNKAIEKDNNFTKDDGKAISKFFDAAIKAHGGKSAGAVAEPIAWEDKLKTLQGLQLGGKNVFQNIEGTTDLAGVLNSDWSTLNPDLIGAGGILTKKQSKDGKKQLEALNKVIEKDNNFTKDDGKAISKFFDAAIKAHDGKSAGAVTEPIAWEDKLKTLQGLQLGGKNVFQNIEGTTDLAGVLNSDWSTLNQDLIGAGGILTKKQSKDGKKQLEVLNKVIKKDNNFTKDDGKAISKFFDAAIKAHDGKSAGVVAEPKSDSGVTSPQIATPLQAKLTIFKEKLVILQGSMAKLQGSLAALKNKLIVRPAA